MIDDTQNTSNEIDIPESEGRQNLEITPELVNEVADKVYAMLYYEMIINHERQRSPRVRRYPYGGW